MSATFDVFPASEQFPTFGELLEVAEAYLRSFLRTYGIHHPVQFSVGMRDAENRVLPIDLYGPAWWPQEQFAWFHIPGVAGGSHAYARPLDDLDRSILSNEIRSDKDPEFRGLIQRSLQVGRYWCFRRTSGQPAIIDLGYGLIAASLAELTDGFLHSVDSAWGYRLLPARPADFLRWYFRPELAINAPNREWAERCIGNLHEELRGTAGGRAA